MKNKYQFGALILSITLVFAFCLTNNLYSKKQFTFEDIMKFKSIRFPVISDDGNSVAYTLVPDRGDPKTVVYYSWDDSSETHIDGNPNLSQMKYFKSDTSYTVERGSKPLFSKNSKWVAMTLNPKAFELDNAEKDKPKSGMALVNIINGKVNQFDKIQKFEFSNDSKYIAYLQFSDDKSSSKDTKSKRIIGSDMYLRQLEGNSDLLFQNVTDFTFDSSSKYLVFAIATSDGKNNGLYYLDLANNYFFPKIIEAKDDRYYSSFAWDNKIPTLAFIKGKENKKSQPDSCGLNFWYADTKSIFEAIDAVHTPANWFIPYKNNLKWTQDGKRIFFGLRSIEDTTVEFKKVVYNDSNYYNIDTISYTTDMDLWHWNDPIIKPNERIKYKENADKLYMSLYNLTEKKLIQLTDKELQDVELTDNEFYTMGFNDKPYLKEISWDGWYKDLYKIDLRDGSRKLIHKRLGDNAQLSPLGKFIIFFANKNWQLYNCQTDSIINLTSRIEFPFYDEDNDEPKEPDSYGIGGWFENDDAVIIYDKYDFWKFQTRGPGFFNQTAGEGRASEIIFRLYNLDPDKKSYGLYENLLVSGFNDNKKTLSVYKCQLSILGYEIMLEDGKKNRILAKSKFSDKLLYTKETSNEFPNLWLADTNFYYSKKISDANPEMNDFSWCNTQLIEWQSSDGDTLQGYVVKPENFDPQKRYPVIVYFYEKESQNLNSFHLPRLGNIPSFQLYTNDDYIIFCPDIIYKIGDPGQSSYNCIIPGVKKLVDMGIADPKALGLWGHSWSGYQTCYIITRTDMFSAAVAGAPVGNMTSAYSGLRLGTGLGRQFQYEKAQSRIGGTLWDSLDSYLRNSPIFYAKSVKTPLLIEFGNNDDAVPWTQGIELYLTMRRLNKNCIMIEYKNELHVPRKYQNRLDYSIRMKEFYDYYLKNKTAPDWIINGIKFNGK